MPLSRVIVYGVCSELTKRIVRIVAEGEKPLECLCLDNLEELQRVLADGTSSALVCVCGAESIDPQPALQAASHFYLPCPALVVSGDESAPAAVRAFKAGALDYLHPRDLEGLPAALQAALASSHSGAENGAGGKRVVNYQRLAENARDVIYRVALEGEPCFDYISPAVEELTGYPPEKFYSDPRTVFDLVHPEEKNLLESMTNGSADMGCRFVIRWRHRDGFLLWAEHRNVPVFGPGGNTVALEGIGRDITEYINWTQKLQSSHDRIEALTAGTLKALEEERARLARELHDEVGQALTAVKLDLQLLADSLALPEGGGRQLFRSVELIDHTLDLVRRQSVSLRPPALDDMGLLPAIREMVRGFMKRTAIKTDLDTNGYAERLPGHVETALYRCIQESLTNVARHSRASAVTVRMARRGECLFVAVEDNGVGFNPEKLQVSSEHIGLTGIRERVRLLQGSMTIDSAPGQGTRVHIEVPCPYHQGDAEVDHARASCR